MSSARQPIVQHGLSLGIVGLSLIVVQLIGFIDARGELSRRPSNRFRFHAIPVALSQLYHNRQHDYTAWKSMAFRFQADDRELDILIKEYAEPTAPIGKEIYFWTADDRGLSDYVALAFRIYGPELRSLSRLYVLLLSASIIIFAIGFWRNPLALALPLLVATGILLLLCCFQLRSQLPVANGSVWMEEIALYESRVFEVLALVAWLHLAIVAAASQRISPLAWLTAIPQAALLLFLFHARSSLGWMYLALFVIVLARMILLARDHWIRKQQITTTSVIRPLFAAALLATSIACLNAYKKAVYHPEYFAERGSRTFWHNALMGYTYNPRLNEEHRLGVVDDAVVDLVLRRMRERNDYRLNENWTKENILNSLGSHCTFDWVTYERLARQVYFDIWKRQPGEAALCYAWYKPKDAANQMFQSSRLAVSAAHAESPALFIASIVFVFGALLATGWWIAQDESSRRQLAAYSRLGLVLAAFSAIPCIAFYAALSTMSGLFVALFVTIALWLLRGAVLLFGKRSTGAHANVAAASGRISAEAA